MSYRDNPPASVVTSSSKLRLFSQEELRVLGGIVTEDLSVIPKIVFFSQLLLVTKGVASSPDYSFVPRFFPRFLELTPQVNRESFLPGWEVSPNPGVCWAASLAVSD